MTVGFGPNNQKSARIITKMLVDLICPESVLDIGCATGIWLHEFQKYSCVKKIQGVDGEWVLGWPLYIERDNIEIHDFESSTPPMRIAAQQVRFGNMFGDGRTRIGRTIGAYRGYFDASGGRCLFFRGDAVLRRCSPCQREMANILDKQI